VTLESGVKESATSLILSEGKSPRLALMLGLEHDAQRGIDVDQNGMSRVEGVYVVGRLRRPGRSQAIISAGDGAAAAIDIMSRRKGEDVADWDSPPEG
jgi:thioredoxin reductase (NADPH)